MEVLEFKNELKEKAGITLQGNYIVFNTYELYNEVTDESVQFKDFDELINYKVDDKTIKQLIEERENLAEYDDGGRGQGTSNKRGGSLFSGTRTRTGGKGESLKPLPPAYINTLTSSRYKSVEGTSKAYGKKFLNADREYGGVIDENGFAVDYTKGNRTSVQHLERPGMYSIHNHPQKYLQANAKKGTIYYNAPSGQDLRNWAIGKGKGTIVVSSGNRTMYIVQRSNGFKPIEFVKGMRKAKSTGVRNYDKDVDKWLKDNQKTYGYKYTKKKF